MQIRPLDVPMPSAAPAAEGVSAGAERAAAAKAAEPAAPAPAANPPPQQVREAVAQANRSLQAINQAIRFEVDPDTREMVIKLVDTENERVLRQVPSKEMLAIARALDNMQTLLVRGKA